MYRLEVEFTLLLFEELFGWVVRIWLNTLAWHVKGWNRKQYKPRVFIELIGWQETSFMIDRAFHPFIPADGIDLSVYYIISLCVDIACRKDSKEIAMPHTRALEGDIWYPPDSYQPPIRNPNGVPTASPTTRPIIIKKGMIYQEDLYFLCIEYSQSP